MTESFVTGITWLGICFCISQSAIYSRSAPCPAAAWWTFFQPILPWKTGSHVYEENPEGTITIPLQPPGGDIMNPKQTTSGRGCDNDVDRLLRNPYNGPSYDHPPIGDRFTAGARQIQWLQVHFKPAY